MTTELRVLEQASGAEYEQVSAEIAETEEALRAAKAEQKTAGDNAATEHDKLVAGRRDLQRGGETLVVAMSELFAQAAVFAPYAHGDLRPLLGVTETAPWPGASSWPDPGQAAAALAVPAEADPVEADPVEAIRAILPAGRHRPARRLRRRDQGRPRCHRRRAAERRGPDVERLPGIRERAQGG